MPALIDRSFAPVEAAINEGRIPCGALGIITREGKRGIRFAGQAQLKPRKMKLKRNMLFDLASLTKVLLTTPLILKLAAENRIALDDPLARHIPDLFQYQPGHRIRKITIRQCLAHCSGLPAVEPIYTWGNDPATLEAHVLQREWPFGANVYSDINFVLLGILIERVTGKPLRAALPAGDFAAMPGPSRAVATEHCMWRKRVLRGEAHDENCFALGGLTGHAGLFGTLDAVLSFAADFLNGRIVTGALLDECRREHSPGRGLGWQVKHGGWPGGDGCSGDTIGHTGFTGTGLWIDFKHGIAWSLLTNRVHPSRHVETGIVKLRREVGNLISAG